MALTTATTSPYIVRTSPGEGLGCFATSTIHAGSLILAETPLFSVAEPRTNPAVTAAFSHLPTAQQDAYLTLYAQNPTTTSQGPARIIDIFNSNAWQTGSHTSICPRAARFNHACIPNASFAWNSRLSQITVHAIVDIAAGTQIKLSYERPYQTSSSRRDKLAAYGFVCTCAACASDAVASDARRSRMVVLDSRIRSGRRQLWRFTMPKAALELVKLLKEEGLVGEALGLAYHDVAAGWKRYGRLDLAIGYAEKELEIAVVCFGVDSPAVDATRAFLAALKVERGHVKGYIHDVHHVERTWKEEEEALEALMYWQTEQECEKQEKKKRSVQYFAKVHRSYIPQSDAVAMPLPCNH